MFLKTKKSKQKVHETQLSLFSFDNLLSTTKEVAKEFVAKKDTKKEQKQESEKTQSLIPRVIGKIIAKATNYKFSPEHNLYEKGAKAKCRNNIAAIKLLKELENEGRKATTEEQIILAKYVGWGGLSEALSENKTAWEIEYKEIRSILTEEEFKSAQESTITAFYTEHFIIEAIYQALERFGFKGGNILEPGCGVGNFYSMLPDSMKNSKLYGIEIDQISGLIAKHLYPEAHIEINGYEETELPDQFFDVAIGNIPFNDIQVYDVKYDKYRFKIHDYFIAKTIDKVRPGGIIAFITSKGTLDKSNRSIRDYIHERATLIGAIRLPNNAFKEVAGTSVTADIIFLQKRESVLLTPISEPWLTVSETENNVPINQYFINNPEMLLGTMEFDSSMYGSDSLTACHPIEGTDLKEQLSKCINLLNCQYQESSTNEETSIKDCVIPADFNVKNFSYTVIDNEIYYRENSKMYKQNFTGKKADRIKGLVSIHKMVKQMINFQNEYHSDKESFDTTFNTYLRELNSLYDNFVRVNGFINSKVNVSAFALDGAAPLLQSLEVEKKDEKDVYEKGTFFFKPTINAFKTPTSAHTADEALKISLNIKGCVDLAFMSEIYSKGTGTTVLFEEITNELGDKLFQNPVLHHSGVNESLTWEVSEKYLSGKVKEKLAQATYYNSLYDGKFDRNVKALQEAQPTPLLPDEISFILGSTWIPLAYYRDFMYHLLQVNERFQEYIKLEYSELSNIYRINGKSVLSHSVEASKIYGTDRINGFEIFEDTLNLKSVEVRDRVEVVYPSGSKGEKYVLNQTETLLAREKQAQIKMEFEQWLFSDPNRSSELTQLYNDKFNNIRPRHYNGDDLILPGMTDMIKLEKHQRDVIAHGIYGEGNLLIAQEVGAGKTYSAIAISQELKRLGIFSKPLFVVPNHLVSQWAKEYMTLYPSANILVAEKKDLEKKRRKRFVSRIATGDYDAILMAHSSFELINMSVEYRKDIMQEELDEIAWTIQQLRAEDGNSFSLKQAVIFEKKLAVRYEKLFNEEKKDNVIYFEELGVDCLIVDEAHAYKNNFTYTKLQNVAGLGNTRSQRAMDMYMKVQYINQKYNGRGAVYLTGTPVSNSMSELHVLQKTLQPNDLKERGLLAFDAWASTFGRIESSLEIKPEGNGYQLKNRFARFHNLPELMSLFSLIADIKTSEMLNLPTPDLKDGKPTVVKTTITEEQQNIVLEHGERAELIRNGSVDSTEDNFLKLTMEARLNAIDPRILNDAIPYNPDTKLNICAKNVADIYHDTAADKLTQIIFCDQGTPKDGVFNFYDAIKEELIKLNVNSEDIVFIHSAKTDAQRLALFEKVISGDVRVLIGSTSKMGTGVNVQNKLIALHHLDIPWRPADLTQRNGRILRRGNENKEVSIFNYITEDTFDGYLWQILEQKQRYISQVMTGRSFLRSCEDIDNTTLQYAEFKALAIADPRIKHKMEIDNEVNRLTLLKSLFVREQSKLNERVTKTLPNSINRTQRTIEFYQSDLTSYKENKNEVFEVELNGVKFYDRDEAVKAINEVTALTVVKYGTSVKLGTYEGFEYGLAANSYYGGTEVYLKGKGTYLVKYIPQRTLNQVEKIVEALEEHLNKAINELEEFKRQLSTGKAQLQQSFPHEAKLKELQMEKSKLDLELEFDKPVQ